MVLRKSNSEVRTQQERCEAGKRCERAALEIGNVTALV